MKILPIAILAATAATANSAGADTMYKCTDPNGKVAYSDQPCTGKSKAATLNVIAPQRKVEVEDDDDDSMVSLRRQKPKETELERLRRADAEFQERLRKREESEMESEIDRQTRMANEVRQRLKPKPVDPKQTILSAPTRSELEREAKRREQEEKRRRDSLLPSAGR